MSLFFFETNINSQGWARRVETRGKFLFLHISDGCSLKTVQVVVQRDICPKVPVGSAVDIVGDWLKSYGKQQSMELYATNCEIVGLQKKSVGFLFCSHTSSLKFKFNFFKSSQLCKIEQFQIV